MILPLVVPCLLALAARILNLLLSAAIPVSVPPAATCTPLTGLLLCLLRLFLFSIDIVFTIAHELRPFFLMDRSLLNCLFSSVNSVVLRLFHKLSKSELFTPGFIIPLGEILNGTLIFTVLFLRAGLAILSCGGM